MKTEHIENNRRILIIDDSQSIQADSEKFSQSATLKTRN